MANHYNTMRVLITLDEAGLKLINNTPTLKNLFHANQLLMLKVGQTELNVSKPTYARMMNLLNTVNPFTTKTHISCTKL
jgi:hypothetical protein